MLPSRLLSTADLKFHIFCFSHGLSGGSNCVQDPETSIEKFVFDDDIRLTDSRGEREFPFPVIPGNTSLKFPFPSRGIL